MALRCLAHGWLDPVKGLGLERSHSLHLCGAVSRQIGARTPRRPKYDGSCKEGIENGGPLHAEASIAQW